MGLHLHCPACYAEAAMDTSDRSQRFRLCRSPKLTPARLAACRSNASKSSGPRTARGKARASLNALKHGRYARRLTSTLKRAGEREQLQVYWGIVERISMHFRVDWQREQQKTERLARPARQVWCYGWKAVGRVKMNPASAGSSSSYKNNSLFPIRIEGNARESALKFVFGRRRLTALAIEPRRVLCGVAADPIRPSGRAR
ncbi:MAG: hypothetical protein ACRD22_04140 [Terriglobia bacterium]